jgi:hypothetical protein
MGSTLRLLLLLALLVPAAFAEAQEAAPSCSGCASRGWLDCRQHRGDLLELERAVEHCSVATACPRCAGALAVDCRDCSNAAAEAELAAAAARAAAWLAERRATIAAHCAAPDEVLFLRTAHCDLSFTLAPMTVGRKKLDSHLLMHLYGARIEALHRRFVEVLGLAATDFPVAAADVSPRLGVHLFEDARDQRAIAPRVTGIGSQGTGVKSMGSFLAYSMQRDPRTLRGDDDLHRNLAHNVVHLLMSSMLPTQWIGNQGQGWLDEGLAHWFEAEVDGRCANFCFEEVGHAPGANWKNGRWRVGIRQLAEAGGLRRFTEIYQLNSDQLDFEAHAHAFAFVDHLIAVHGGPKLAELIRRAKRREAMRDALQAVYGFGPLQFDERFAAWVKETYPLR